MSVIVIYDLASHFRSYYHLIGDLNFKSLKITIIILINKPPWLQIIEDEFCRAARPGPALHTVVAAAQEKNGTQTHHVVEETQAGQQRQQHQQQQRRRRRRRRHVVVEGVPEEGQ